MIVQVPLVQLLKLTCCEPPAPPAALDDHDRQAGRAILTTLDLPRAQPICGF